MTPSPECAHLFEKAKRYSNAHRNFRGSAVLVASAVVAMQHRRTSGDGGVISTEMISREARACLAGAWVAAPTMTSDARSVVRWSKAASRRAANVPG